jgi:molecular chaperone DnaK
MILGIDLGTTNSVVAYMEGMQAEVIAGREGSRTMPSIVAVSAKGERLVGHLAKRQMLTNPRHTVSAVKRLIGRKYVSEEVGRARENLPYEIVEAANGDVRIRVRERDFSPQEISAMILGRMREVAEEHLGQEVSEAVVTVPAYFDDQQRQATKDAGRIAGLKVERIINEPTAAALAYGMSDQSERIVAVYDLGGGTFDISILRLAQGVFEVLSTHGDTYLGGEDFDQRIVDWLLGEFLQDTGIDLRPDRLAMQRLKEAAEKAKCELSREAACEINLPFLAADQAGPRHLNRSLTREMFEDLVRDLVDRTRGPCQEALKLAGLQAAQVEEVLLVGGQTRTPLVGQTVSDLFGRDPNATINPDEVVGIGAALQAGILQGDVKDMVLLDVTPLSLGIETRGGMFTRIIDRSTKIPTRKSRIFTTVVDNQGKVEVHVLQGERELANHNRSLGRFDLVGIPPAPRGVPQISVAFDIDSNGIVHVSAQDEATGAQQRMVVQPSGGLTEQEIQAIVADAQAHADEDRVRAQLMRDRARLEGLLDTNEKSFREFGNMLEDGVRRKVRKIIDASRRALSSDQPGEIRAALEKLGEVSQVLTDVILYDPTTFRAEDPGGEGESEGGGE